MEEGKGRDELYSDSDGTSGFLFAVLVRANVSSLCQAGRRRRIGGDAFPPPPRVIDA